MLKVALIGTGTMGQEHAAAWASVKNAKVTAVCGRNREKAAQIAAPHGAEVYDDPDELLGRADIDAVDICLPTDLHGLYIEKAAQHGKHILCEKPLALSSSEARRLIDLCKSRNVSLLVSHDLRFCPEYRQAGRLAKEGKLGRIGVARLSRRSRYPEGSGGWYADGTRSGGVILDLLIHDLDWARWTFGEAQRVTCLRTHGPSGEEPLDYALVVLRMHSGVLVHLEASWAHTEFGSSLEIAGSGGMLVEHLADSMPLSIHRRSGPGLPPAVAVPEMSLRNNSYELELRHFADCLLRGEEPEVTAYDAMKAVELAEAAVLSARTGRPVTLGGGGMPS